METIFWNMGNSKASEPHTFVLNLSQKLDLRSSNKHAALQNFSICYTWENKRQQYKNHKLKITVPTRNDKFELPDRMYYVSDIQHYIEYIKNTKRK